MRVQALANYRVGAALKEGIAADMEVLIVGGLFLLVDEGAGCVVC
jgi:cellobiose-specific phosphotransferase system component IIC